MLKLFYSIPKLLLIILFSLSTLSMVKAQKNPPYKNPKLPTEQRVADLLQRMTLEEKVGQLLTLLGWEMYEKQGNQVDASEKFKQAVQKRHIGLLWATLRADPWTRKTLETGLTPELAAKATNAMQKYVMENTRLGIPIMLSEECPHGHMAIGTTVFPTSIGQSSTWDPELIQKMASTIAMEARVQGGHVGYGPVLDLAREPRWSRVEETYGEDPVLNSAMGQAMVHGFQGSDLQDGEHVISTLKHFTAYGVPEGGHNGNSISVGQRELFESYLPPFKAAVEAGALSVMTAYNAIDGVPCTANEFLLKNVLHEQWGFQGFLVSDLGSIEGIQHNHFVAATAEEAAALAINAGLDADLGGNGFGKNLIDAVQNGKVSEQELDRAVGNVLRMKFDLGLFENPYVDTKKARNIVRNEEHIALARQVAQESVILLKNENNALPLSRELKKIAVIGPNADNIYNQLGDYTAPQSEDNIVTVLEGIQNKMGSTAEVTYVKGCAIRDTTQLNIEDAVGAAENADVAIVVLGGSSARDFKTKYIHTGAATVGEAKENETISDMESGEGFDRATLTLLGKQMELLRKVQATGTPVVLVLIKGRPLNLNWATENIPAIVDAWYPGQEGGNAIADVLFGDYNPAGRLPISVPKSVGQLPVYYNAKPPMKHDYVEMDSKPLYSFGHGLSYANFKYSQLQVQPLETDSLHVSVSFSIKNTSTVAGDEVAQLYIRDLASSTVTPLKQLKKFQRLHFEPGEEKKISFSLKKEDLQLLDQKMQWVVEPGTFTAMVGASSEDLRLEANFDLTKNW